MNKSTKLPQFVMALAQDPPAQAGEIGRNGTETELKKFKKIVEETVLVNLDWPEDPLLKDLKKMILETLFKFSIERDGGWHNNRLNLQGEVEEITVKMKDHFGNVFVPQEVKIKSGVKVPIVRGRLFDNIRPYIKLDVSIKRQQSVKIGKKFFQPQSNRVIIYDLQKGGPAKIIGVTDIQK